MLWKLREDLCLLGWGTGVGRGGRRESLDFCQCSPRLDYSVSRRLGRVGHCVSLVVVLYAWSAQHHAIYPFLVYSFLCIGTIRIRQEEEKRHKDMPRAMMKAFPKFFMPNTNGATNFTASVPRVG